jgi:hypothetical protein
MKATISKEQSAELRKWLDKQRVPKATADLLLNSNTASNTYKAYRLKKQITTPDGWVIHFGTNSARPLEQGESVESDALADEVDAESGENEADGEEDDIKKAGDTFVSRTFMGLAEKLKKLKIEDADSPQMQKIAFELDKDHLAMLKKYATIKGITVGALIRQAIREFLESV